MVHQTISTKIKSAPSASSNNKTIRTLLRALAGVWILGTLLSCASPPLTTTAPAAPDAATPASTPDANAIAQLPAIQQARSVWTAASWSDLPGFDQDTLHQAWNAWLQSCQRPNPAFASLCSQARRFSIGTSDEQRNWLKQNLQPYQVQDRSGQTHGLLTAYYEPELYAQRVASGTFSVPLYSPPASLGKRKPWYTRQEIDTQASVQAELQNRVIAYLANPIDALILQIQGSGRVHITEPDGRVNPVRLAFAASNEQPYKSVARWLLDQGALRDTSWAAIKTWAAQNPQRVNAMLWSNPRTVFFREEALDATNTDSGPRGAQGVPLTPGRSIAVDPTSIPYGTPLWLSSHGPGATLNKLVLAQDTGSAIVGAVRADYFAGWGNEAGEFAGRIKQPLRLWVLWPK
jgi:membrane-bound lytic murein transglycosylase A